MWDEELMPCEETPTSIRRVKSNFRLWLTSYPSHKFPSSLLQPAVKVRKPSQYRGLSVVNRLNEQVVLESPSGLAANLRLALTTPPVSEYGWFTNVGERARAPFRRLVYALAAFHGVVLERRDYGALGWSDGQRYEFDRSDLAAGLQQLRQAAVLAAEKVSGEVKLPLRALQYLMAECYYGGRVTDQWDRRLLHALLQHFFCEASASQRGRALAEGLRDGRDYRIPEDLSLSHCIEAASALPDATPPAALGLADNAAAAKNLRESEQMLVAAAKTQPRLAAAAMAASSRGRTSDAEERAAAAAASSALLRRVRRELLARVPADLDIPPGCDGGHRLNDVLRLESSRFNQLLAVVRHGLDLVERSLGGQIVMSAEIERVFSAVLADKVPEQWESVSYPTALGLRDYLSDLTRRVNFFAAWANTSVDGKPALPPKVFWLPAFYFPQSLLNALRQTFSAERGVDATVSVRLEVMPLKEAGEDQHGETLYLVEEKTMTADQLLASRAPGSAIVDGLGLQGAVWDSDLGQLAEVASDAPPVTVLPPVLLEPTTADENTAKTSQHDDEPFYECPIYRNERRRGEVLPSGHNTNFVFSARLASGGRKPSHWVRRAVAAIIYAK